MSDREWLATKESTPALTRNAKAMVEAGKGEDILFRDHEGGNGAPVCARRFLSLADRGGDDDMFSSDYSDEELKVNFAREEEHSSTVHFEPSHCMAFEGHVHVLSLDRVLCDRRTSC